MGTVVVLGVDPGLVCTGYGVVRATSGAFHAEGHGVVRPPVDAPLAERLLFLQRALLDFIRSISPDAVAIEEPFVGANNRSALTLGRAQAAALIAAAEAGVVVHAYTPAQVKDVVAGHGRSDKRQVAEMVRMQLGLPTLPTPADAADALAIALCHAALAGRPAFQAAAR